MLLSDLAVGRDCLDYRQVRALMTGKIIPVITDVLKIRARLSRSLVKIGRKATFPKCDVTSRRY